MINDEIFIVAFGEAKLFKRLNGEYELRHGTAVERHEAIEWISRFLPEALPHLEKDRGQQLSPGDDDHSIGL